MFSPPLKDYCTMLRLDSKRSINQSTTTINQQSTIQANTIFNSYNNLHFWYSCTYNPTPFFSSFFSLVNIWYLYVAFTFIGKKKSHLTQSSTESHVFDTLISTRNDLFEALSSKPPVPKFPHEGVFGFTKFVIYVKFKRLLVFECFCKMWKWANH